MSRDRAPAERGGRVLALDGVRAFAVITVCLYHLFVPVTTTISWKPWKPTGGFLTLDIFFVLSGFLITSLLLGEHDRRGSISLKGFYQRRALRLFPALAVLLVVAGVAAALWTSQPWSKPTLQGLPWVIFYVANWRIVLNGSIPADALRHTWSLAVEEQFYIVWPLILLLVLRRNGNRVRIAAVLLAVAVAEMVYRFVAIVVLHWPAVDPVFYRTDTHSDGLIIGCALAFFIAAQRERPPLSEGFHRILAGATVAAVIGLILLVMRERAIAPSAFWFGISAAVVCSAVIVLNLVTRPLPVLAWVLELRPVVWVGKRTYGIYLWQSTIQFLLRGVRNHHGLNYDEWEAMLLLLPIGIAAVSYRYIELPFLRRKRTFQRSDLVQELRTDLKTEAIREPPL